ncbi:MAG: hypothetical protein VKJ09_09315 [Leptolyngbya sp.]|nr:hypothetical protein [Leptolyngbya sp.]
MVADQLGGKGRSPPQIPDRYGSLKDPLIMGTVTLSPRPGHPLGNIPDRLSPSGAECLDGTGIARVLCGGSCGTPDSPAPPPEVRVGPLTPPGIEPPLSYGPSRSPLWMWIL